MTKIKRYKYLKYSELRGYRGGFQEGSIVEVFRSQIVPIVEVFRSQMVPIVEVFRSYRGGFQEYRGGFQEYRGGFQESNSAYRVGFQDYKLISYLAGTLLVFIISFYLYPN